MTELRQLKPAQTGRPNLTENHQKCSKNDENRPKNHENSLKIAKNPAKTSNLPRHRKTPVSRSQILTSSTPMLPWQRISDHSRPDTTRSQHSGPNRQFHHLPLIDQTTVLLRHAPASPEASPEAWPHARAQSTATTASSDSEL